MNMIREVSNVLEHGSYKKSAFYNHGFGSAGKTCVTTCSVFGPLAQT
jgi:hypothetical protein